MKAKQKKLIIVAVVVAVALYFIWKNSKAAKDGGSNDTGGSTGGGTAGTRLDPSNLEDCITAGELTTSEADKVRQKYRDYQSYAVGRQQIIDKAKVNGLTYEQQLVCEVIYVMYHTYNAADGTWSANSTTERNRWLYVTELVKAM